MSQIQSEIVAGVGLITLDRPEALNALSLQMVIDLTAVFTDWRDDPNVEVVAIRGSNKRGVFGAFCAGGDIRFFHDAAIAEDPALGRLLSPPNTASTTCSTATPNPMPPLWMA